MPNDFNGLVRFGDLTFDPQANKLSNDGQETLLSPKEGELLALLLERGGKFVSKEEIFEKVWPETFVEDGVLAQNIYKLRKALGKNPDGGQMIENRTRLGYRITVPIIATHEDNATRQQTVDQTFAKPETIPVPAAKRKKLIAVSVAALSLVVLSFIGYRLFRPQIASFFRKPIETVKFTKLTNSGDIYNATISPDGNLLAYISDGNVFLKDIVTEKAIKLDIPQVPHFGALQFSPDGNLLYFRNTKLMSTRAQVMKVSRFGGEPETVVDEAWGSFSVSPDGKKIAYFFNMPTASQINLKVRELETGNEKEFVAAEQPNSPCWGCTPAWSPDGGKIIFTVSTRGGTGQMFAVNLASDTKEEVKLGKLRRFEQAAWLPDGNSFIVSASEGSRFFHLWKVYYPDGDVQPMTNGLSNYARISVTADGKKILALETSENSNIFIADANNLENQKQITEGKQNNVGQTGLNWADDNKILYSTQTEQNMAENLAVIDSANGSKVTLTNEKQNAARLPTSDGKFVWFTVTKSGFANIHQVGLDGKDLKQLTDANDGQRSSPRISNDGRYLYYVVRGKDVGNIRRFDLQSQKEEIFFNDPEIHPAPFLELSPDNNYLTFFNMQDRTLNNTMDKYNAVMVVVSTKDTSDIKSFPVSAIPPVRRFSPDSKFVDYISAETDGSQIVRHAFDDSEPKPLYTFSEGRIFNFAWSKDGKRLAISKGEMIRDAVLLTEFDN